MSRYEHAVQRKKFNEAATYMYERSSITTSKKGTGQGGGAKLMMGSDAHISTALISIGGFFLFFLDQYQGVVVDTSEQNTLCTKHWAEITIYTIPIFF